jgi:glycosyltransferase involved in cell wall biosynthesis
MVSFSARKPRPSSLSCRNRGRVTNVKGITYALQAMKGFNDLDKLQLDIIGSGPLLDELTTETETLNLTNRVRFHGFQRNILDWMANLDVLLIPSLHEGLPYTLLEAMSLNLPIVASNVGGLAEVLRHDETGLLVEVAHVEGIAQALSTLYTDDTTRNRLGAAASREQRDCFKLQRMGDKYVEVYEAVLASTSNKS